MSYFLLATSNWAIAGQKVQYAVLYPQVRAEYESVFLSIIQGIKNTAFAPSLIKKIAPDTDPQSIEQELHQNNIDVVIALGSRSYEFSRQMENPPPVLVGATRDTVKRFSSLSLAMSPRLMLDKLHQLAPKIERITIVYNPDENDWFVKDAQQAATTYGLTLNTIKVSNLKEAAQAYAQFFDRVDRHKEALWLPLDETSVNEKVTVPIILTRAWEQQVLIFSCSPLHARRGALFSVYPDNQRVGEDLGDLLTSAVIDQQQKIYPMQRGMFALNRQTIEHLNLKVSDQLQSEFEMQFPLK